MDSDTTMHNEAAASPERIVEFELRLPTRDEIKLPQMPAVDLEPVRRTAEQVLLVGLGAAVLASRAVRNAVEKANEAGAEAAEHPGPVARTLLNAVRERPQRREPAAPRETRRIRVLPIADYDQLDAEEIVRQLHGMNEDELVMLRDYEMDHQRRTVVIRAIDTELSATI